MSSEASVRAQRSTLKQGLAIDDVRRKRQEQSITLRKNRREESVLKRRQMAAVAPEALAAAAVTSSPFLAAQQNSTDALSTPVKSSATTAHANLTVEQRLALLPKFVSDLQALPCNRQSKFDGVVNIRKLLSIEKNPHITEVLQSGALPLLLKCLADPSDAELQCEAAWAITNIASGNSSHTRVVVESGAIPLFVQIINYSSSTLELKDQCAWALGNIAGDCTEFRDLCLASNVLMALLSFMHSIIFTNMSKVTLLRNSTWAVSNLCRGKPQPQWNQIENALPAMAHILDKVQDEETLTDACWALSYMSDDSTPRNDRIQSVLNSGVLNKLVALLSHSNANLRVPALRTIGNLVTGSDEQTQKVLDAGVIGPLSSLIAHGKRSIRKEACWAVSNVTAGTSEQIARIVCSDILPKLITVLKEDVYEVQREACWALTNATATGHSNIINTLVHANVLEGLCSMLSVHDNRMVVVVLEALENILRVGKKNAGNGKNKYVDAFEEVGGLDALEKLQKHENEEIYKKTTKLITTYFEVEDENEEQYALQPQQNSNQFTFAVEMPKNSNVMQPLSLAPFSFGKPGEQQPFAPFGQQPAAGGFTFGAVSF